MSNDILDNNIEIGLVVFDVIFVLFIFDCDSVIFYINVIVFD